MARVLMLTADSGEELEVYYMLHRLREAGHEVDVAAPERKRLNLVVHDFEPGWDTYVERPGRGLDADLAFSDVDPERYAALLIPGGRAPEVIRNDPDVQRIVAHFFDSDLPVGHMCHGVQVPAAFGYVRGRRVSAFPPLAADIEAAGGEFVGVPVVDGNMVSATGWPDLAEWSRAFMEVLDRAEGAARGADFRMRGSAAHPSAPLARSVRTDLSDRAPA